MSYTLIISEKPSAAKRIAESLSTGELKKLGRKDASYYRITRKGKEIIVVPAVGHLFVLDQKEKSDLDQLLTRSVKAVEMILLEGVEKAMSAFNMAAFCEKKDESANSRI